jgi:hypothetical protein
MVWRAEVEPWRLLAKITYEGSGLLGGNDGWGDLAALVGFAEYVVDTDGLEVVLDDPLL